jgi:hypothetical protein
MKLQLFSIITIGFLLLLLLIGITYNTYAINPPKGGYESKSFQITNMSAIYKGSFIGDNYDILGLIKNIDNKTFDGDVAMFITLYDKNGNLIGLEETTPIFDVSNPGNSSEFKFDIRTNSSLFDHYIVKIGIKEEEQSSIPD